MIASRCRDFRRTNMAFFNYRFRCLHYAPKKPVGGNRASMSGRVLALHGAVTLDNNVITADNFVSTPEPATFWLLAACVSVFGTRQLLAMWRRTVARS